MLLLYALAAQITHRADTRNYYTDVTVILS